VRASAILAAVALTAASVCVAAQSSPAPPTAKDGVYTTAQAERGNDAYSTSCAHCHASDLQGDVRKEIPALAESDFFVRWSNRSLGELYEMISKDMPADKPGSLTPLKAADVLAYILSVNGFPAGPAELPADAARLKAIDLGTK
jgi:mono/diheme cytochrome c family protein